MKKLWIVFSVFFSLTSAHGLSDTEFFALFDEAMDSGLDKVVLMDNNGMDAIGTETVSGKISGTLTYTAAITSRVLGIPSEVKVTLEFDQYNDDGVILNGTLTTLVDQPLKKKGSATGTIEISGTLNGYIRYDTKVKGPVSYEGYFYISQDGGTEVQYDYDYFRE